MTKSAISADATESKKTPAPRKRFRRGAGRSRQVRGSDTPVAEVMQAETPIAEGAPTEAAAPVEAVADPATVSASAAEAARNSPPAFAPERPHVGGPQPAGGVRASGSSISEAVEKIKRIVTALQTALEEMEEALDLLDEAERQQTADETEIASLKAVLNRLQRAEGTGDGQERLHRSQPPMHRRPSSSERSRERDISRHHRGRRGPWSARRIPRSPAEESGGGQPVPPPAVAPADE